MNVRIETMNVISNEWREQELRKWAVETAMKQPPQDFKTALEAAKMFYDWVKTKEGGEP